MPRSSICSETQLEGYTIPANTHIMPLIHAVHHDSSLWDEPERFNPERFLSKDHTRVVKPAFFMPFSTGQRMCIGDQLADKEIFLLFTSLVHTFDFELEDGAERPGLVGAAGATHKPADFSVKFSCTNMEVIARAMQKSEEQRRLDEEQQVRTYG